MYVRTVFFFYLLCHGGPLTQNQIYYSVVLNKTQKIIPKTQDQEGVEFFNCTDEKAFLYEEGHAELLPQTTTGRGTVCEFTCKPGYKTMMPDRLGYLVKNNFIYITLCLQSHFSK